MSSTGSPNPDTNRTDDIDAGASLDSANATANGATAATSKKARTRTRLIAAAIVAAIVVVGAVAYTLVRSNRAKGTTVVTVGLVGDSDEEIWKTVQQVLDSQNAGITIETKSFQDGIYANRAQANGELDLTAFQHYAFLEQEISDNGYELSPIGETYICPLNLYSDKYTDVSQFKAGDQVAIPNNATNTGRALKVLDAAGLIQLADNTKENPTVDDIAANPSGIDIQLVDSASIVNLLPDYAGGITNANFIVDAGKSVSDAVFQMNPDASDPALKPYVNIIVAQTSKKDDPTYQKVVDAYHSKAVADVITSSYDGTYVPVFSY